MKRKETRERELKRAKRQTEQQKAEQRKENYISEKTIEIKMDGNFSIHVKESKYKKLGREKCIEQWHENHSKIQQFF